MMQAPRKRLLVSRFATTALATSNTEHIIFSSDSSESEDAFDPSPIPTKRRRISTTSNEKENSAPKRGRKPAAQGKAEPKPKKPKHRVIIHEQPQPLEDEEDTFTQAAPDDLQSSQPWRLRGAKWSNAAVTTSVPSKPRDAPLGVKAAAVASGSRREPCEDVIDDEPELEATLPPPRPNRESNNTSEALDIAAELADLPSSAFDSFDIQKELADLPSDAFASSSSSPQKSPQRQTTNNSAILISSQISSNQRVNLVGPRNGQVQMNLYGQVAKNQQNAGASPSNKRYNFTVAERAEPPTHHKLDEDALAKWIYPMNIGSIRDYQYNIVQRGLFNNLLVALPTGLGKTFIAATIMLNWYRWTKDAQIVFVAPTKPLVAQQVEACFGIAGIPQSETTMLTGGVAPGLRAEEWLSKRVFFTTPQTVHHDFQSGIADPKKLVLLVVDEAHRATGNYSYVQLVKFIRRFNPSFRVLALTATPGNSVEGVQEVINGLDIARVEIRTESSLDIRQYVHQRKTDRKIFSNSEEMDMIMDWFSKALQPVMSILCQHNAYWDRDPLKITPFGLTQARQKWNATAGKNAHIGVKAQVNKIFSVLASLAHSLELLKYHGLGPFFHTMKAFRNTIATSKGGHKYESMILDNENFQKMMTRLQFWVNNPDFIGHPKLDYLKGLVLEHFSNTADLQEVNADGKAPRETRIMIFAHFRDSAEEICRVLRRDQPMIRPHVFVGQSSSKGSEGMDQKKQQEIITKFKAGEFNTLVATSIGEEGLDIGEVDLIICYDSSASPIRMLQRMGRTGRKRAGAIVLLLMRGKEEDSFVRAKDNYEKMQAMISLGDRFDFHDDKSPRVLPREYNPEPECRQVEIPVENTQAALPEPSKKGRRAPKKPPKKFHMPDNAQLGFVRASRMDASGSDSDITSKRKGPKKSKIAEKNLAEVPSHASVMLSPQAYKDFERQYLHVHRDAEDAVVSAPAADKHPELQRHLQPTKLVRHGRATKVAVDMIERMRMIGTRTTDRWERLASDLDIDTLCGPVRALDHTPTASPVRKTTKPRATAAKRGRPAKNATTAAEKPAPKSKAPARKATAPKTPKARGRPRKFSYTEADNMEGDASSPPPTDPRFALPTQGIDLGSEDTEGSEGADGYIDSSLRAFVVGSDEHVPSGVINGEDDLSSGGESDACGRVAELFDDEDNSAEEEGVAGWRRRSNRDGVEGSDASDSGENSDAGGSESESKSEGSSLPDVGTLMKNKPVLKKPEKGRAGKGDDPRRGDISPASMRLSQAMSARPGKRKRKRVVESEDESDSNA